MLFHKREFVPHSCIDNKGLVEGRCGMTVALPELRYISDCRFQES